MASHTYEQVPIAEKADWAIDERKPQPVPWLPSGTFTATTYLILCLISSSLSFSLGYLLGSYGPQQDLECFRRHSAYSPATSSIDTSYHDVLFNGTLAAKSIYKGEPRSEMEAAWAGLMNFNLTYITGEELAALPGNKDSIRMPPEAHIPDSYLGSLEVFHQLHCLNMLRKTAIWDYAHYNATGHFTDPPDMQKEHHGHCVDMLRQVLQCNADVGIVTLRYVQGMGDFPYPNFNTWHKCRNFESVLEFAESRQIGRDWERDYLRRLEGEMIWDAPP